MNIIAVDCGASYIKAAKIDGESCRILNSASQSAPTVHQEGSISNPYQINALVSVVEDLIFQLSAGEKELSLGFSNEMHGFLLTEADGTPFTDYISWQKEYGKESAEYLSGKFVDDIKKTGMPLRAGLPSCNLHYLDRQGILDRGDVFRFYTLGDYLIQKFSMQEPRCHTTNAAATGMMDIKNGEWNWKYIGCITNKMIKFPQIGSKEITCKKDGIIYHIYPALGDQQAALFGAGLDNEKSLSFNLGTGAQVSVLVAQDDFFIDGYELESGVQIRPFFNGYMLRTMPFIPAGRALNVFFRFCDEVCRKAGRGIDEDRLWQMLLREAERAENEARLSVDLSFFENPFGTGRYGSVGRIGEYDLTIGVLFSSVLKQMTDNYLKAAEIIVPRDRKIDRILFSGGIARRIDMIRKKIMSVYKDANEIVSSDETLVGIAKYIRNEERRNNECKD